MYPQHLNAHSKVPLCYFTSPLPESSTQAWFTPSCVLKLLLGCYTEHWDSKTDVHLGIHLVVLSQHHKMTNVTTSCTLWSTQDCLGWPHRPNLPRPTTNPKKELSTTHTRWLVKWDHVQEALKYIVCTVHTVFNWTPECQEAFKVLKTKLFSSPVLAFPDFDKSLV